MATKLNHPWYSINAKGASAVSAAADAPKTAEVFIYGDIGESWYGDTVAAKDFVKEFAAIEADSITVRLNSYGGSVTDGIAIYNAIKRHAATVTVTIDGIAASVASLIAMAGNTIEMADNALMMVHAPWSIAMGNSADLRTTADTLDKYAASMASSYVQKSGQTHDAIMALLTDGVDHWYSAEEALAAGFATVITSATPVAASISPSALARFRNVPTALASASTQRSIVTPAAAAANPTEKSMTPDEIKAAADANAKALAEATAAATAAGIKAEADRRAAITAAYAKFIGEKPVQEAQAACLADTSVTVDQANAKLLTVLGAGSSSVAGRVQISTLSDEQDNKRTAMGLALEIRAGLIANDSRNPYRGTTLLEMANASLIRNGANPEGMGKMERVAAAFTHSSGDFPLILQNVANKAMLIGFTEANETFQKWTSKGSAPDFKAGTRVDLNSFPALGLVQPGAEYKSATMGEHGATVLLATYGSLFSISRQAIINDDLGEFTRIPRKMGSAAIRTVGNLVYAILTSNPTFNGSALFAAGRNNLLGSGTAITTTSVDAMMTAMALQSDGVATLNIAMKYLLCPVSKRGTASVVRNSEFEVGAGAKTNTVPNMVRDQFEVIADPRLDTNSAIAWYGAADPAAADTIEVTYLDGQDTPVLEQQNGWTVDGVEFKVRMDAGVAPLDFRALYKNPGA